MSNKRHAGGGGGGVCVDRGIHSVQQMLALGGQKELGWREEQASLAAHSQSIPELEGQAHRQSFWNHSPSVCASLLSPLCVGKGILCLSHSYSHPLSLQE